MDLKGQMTELMAFVRTLVVESNMDHREICQTTADHYDLWDSNNRFPLWLSFIVQGEMREQNVER